MPEMSEVPLEGDSPHGARCDVTATRIFPRPMIAAAHYAAFGFQVFAAPPAVTACARNDRNAPTRRSAGENAQGEVVHQRLLVKEKNAGQLQ